MAGSGTGKPELPTSIPRAQPPGRGRKAIRVGQGRGGSRANHRKLGKVKAEER